MSKNVIAVIPEDLLVVDAERRHTPALCLLNNKSAFCTEIQKLAENYVKLSNSKEGR
jgi:hypothetical protein